MVFAVVVPPRPTFFFPFSLLSTSPLSTAWICELFCTPVDGLDCCIYVSSCGLLRAAPAAGTNRTLGSVENVDSRGRPSQPHGPDVAGAPTPSRAAEQRAITSGHRHRHRSRQTRPSQRHARHGASMPGCAPKAHVTGPKPAAPARGRSGAGGCAALQPFLFPS